MQKSLFAVLLLSLLAACTQPDKFGAREITYADLPGWEEDKHEEALATFITSCEVLSRKARDVSTGSNLQLDETLWKSLCDEAKWAQTNPAQARFFFESRFVPFRVNNNDREQGLFTGYYEPMLYGSTRKGGDFQYPLHMAPPELKNNKPYYTHAEINRGALDGRGLEMVWVSDPVMKFFMQIQGSGRVRMTDGREFFIGYADGNGHPYVSIGKVMIDEGWMEKDEVTFFSLRKWLYDNPDKAFDLMERNPSYVFFKKRKKPATGSIGVVLTPMRSIAVESRHIPYGLPVYMEAVLPPEENPVSFNRLMIAQDTGGAIKGPVRADIFFGPGSDAEYYAGNMKNRGFYNLLVPKEIASSLREE